MSNRDDLDDLDDILENALNEFDDAPKTPTTSEKKTTPTTTTTATSSSSTDVPPTINPNDIDLDEVFQKTLTSQEKDVVNTLTEQVTKFFNELQETEEGGSSSTEKTSQTGQSNYNFQDVMKNTLDMLNQNAASMNNPDVVNSSNSAADGGEQDDSVDEGSFSNLLQSMMEVLMSPDILRQPMEELREKYPLWLNEKKGQVSDDEYQRVQRQYDLCCKICNVYESQQYPTAIDELIELMKAMQEQGQPPEEIVSQLSKPEGGSEEESQVHKLLQGLNLTGSSTDGSGLGKAGCPTQ